MDGNSSTTAPISSPLDEEDSGTLFPVTAPSKADSSPPSSTDTTPSLETNDSSFSITSFGTIFVACAIGSIASGFILWKFCKFCKSRRERHMLRLQSTRVDAVLGDMQMVTPFDDDPELI